MKSKRTFETGKTYYAIKHYHQPPVEITIGVVDYVNGYIYILPMMTLNGSIHLIMYTIA